MSQMFSLKQFSAQANPPLMMNSRKYQILLAKNQNHLDSFCHSQLCLYTKNYYRKYLNTTSQNMLLPLNIL